MKRLHTRLGKLTSGLRECSDRINKGTIDSRTLDEQQEELNQGFNNGHKALKVPVA